MFEGISGRRTFAGDGNHAGELLMHGGVVRSGRSSEPVSVLNVPNVKCAKLITALCPEAAAWCRNSV